MKWTVKKGITKHTLRGERQEPAAYIQVKKSGFTILDTTKAPLINILESPPLTLTISETDGRAEGSAKIELARSSSLMRPPRAQRLSLRWRGVDMTMEQSKKREFTVFRGDAQIGIITGVLAPFVSLTFEETLPADMAALLYALALRMLREDDLDMV